MNHPKVKITMENLDEIELELYPEYAPVTVDNFVKLVESGFYNGVTFHRVSRGVLSMARAQNPDSASSQFFIMVEDAPHLDGNYAAFGKVISGMDAVDEIVAVGTDFRDKPLMPVVMKKVELIG